MSTAVYGHTPGESLECMSLAIELRKEEHIDPHTRKVVLRWAINIGNSGIRKLWNGLSATTRFLVNESSEIVCEMKRRRSVFRFLVRNTYLFICTRGWTILMVTVSHYHTENYFLKYMNNSFRFADYLSTLPDERVCDVKRWYFLESCAWLIIVIEPATHDNLGDYWANTTIKKVCARLLDEHLCREDYKPKTQKVETQTLFILCITHALCVLEMRRIRVLTNKFDTIPESVSNSAEALIRIQHARRTSTRIMWASSSLKGVLIFQNIFFWVGKSFSGCEDAKGGYKWQSRKVWLWEKEMKRSVLLLFCIFDLPRASTSRTSNRIRLRTELDWGGMIRYSEWVRAEIRNRRSTKIMQNSTTKERRSMFILWFSFIPIFFTLILEDNQTCISVQKTN